MDKTESRLIRWLLTKLDDALDRCSGDRKDETDLLPSGGYLPRDPGPQGSAAPP